MKKGRNGDFRAVRERVSNAQSLQRHLRWIVEVGVQSSDLRHRHFAVLHPEAIIDVDRLVLCRVRHEIRANASIFSFAAA